MENQIKENLLAAKDKKENTKKLLVTNRKKAIVFANLYMIFHFSYFCCAKISMK